MIILYVEKVLHLSIKEKEHFCSRFLAYRYVDKHMFIYMDESMRTWRTVCKQIKQYNYYAMIYKEKSVEKRK